MSNSAKNLYSKLVETLSELPSNEVSGILEYDLMQSRVSLDLSRSNAELENINCLDVASLSNFINEKISLADDLIGIGGYLEDRNRYQELELFIECGEPRSIHLGIDLWAQAGTKVFAPLGGKVHSFKDNANLFDYGPTIILEHTIDDIVFHTLYGHLCRESLEAIKERKNFDAGEMIGTFGSPEVNGNWPPHLHFQIIIDMESKYGDYPGVSTPSNIDYYKLNCPDPNLLLKLDSLKYYS